MTSFVFAKEPVILILGDSLSASYGMPVESGWTNLLQHRLQEQGYNYTVMNASISGETTFGALIRVDDLLRTHQPVITLIELGGNDGLRGISIEEMRDNLSEIIQSIQNQGSTILLTQITLPPNYGPVYIEKFESVFKELDQSFDIHLTPFILKDVADRPELMQADGIHPTAKAQPRLLENLWPSFKTVLNRLEKAEG